MAHGLGLAIRHGLDFDLGRSAGHEFFDDASAFGSQLHVVGVCPALVAVTFDGELGDSAVGKAFQVGRDAILGAVTERVFIEAEVNRCQATSAFGIQALAVFALEPGATVTVAFAAAAFGDAARFGGCTRASLAFHPRSAVCIANALGNALVGRAFLAGTAVQVAATTIGFATAGASLAGHALVAVRTGAVSIHFALGALGVDAVLAFGLAVLVIAAIGVGGTASSADRHH